jgi:hypothetical protein
MKEKKLGFEYYPLKRQWHLNYKGKDINIDKEDYERMSENEILELIQNLTRQEESKPTDEYMSPEEADEGFKKLRQNLGMPPYDPNKPSFKDMWEYKYGRMRPKNPPL